jgi:hypothetical protein
MRHVTSVASVATLYLLHQDVWSALLTATVSTLTPGARPGHQTMTKYFAA